MQRIGRTPSHPSLPQNTTRLPPPLPYQGSWSVLCNSQEQQQWVVTSNIGQGGAAQIEWLQTVAVSRPVFTCHVITLSPQMDASTSRSVSLVPVRLLCMGSLSGEGRILGDLPNVQLSLSRHFSASRAIEAGPYPRFDRPTMPSQPNAGLAPELDGEPSLTIPTCGP